MWRSKKLIIVATLAAVVLIGTIGGIALAQENGDDNGDNSQPQTLLARVAAILGIDQQELENAVTQAKSEMQAEALDGYLNNLVDEGKISQEEANQYKAWWQARPDMEPYRQQLEEWQQARPDIPPELREWREAMPDIRFRFRFDGLDGPRFGRGIRSLWNN